MKKPYRTLQTVCIHCGKAIEHRYTGRPKKFCSDVCRTQYGRVLRRWKRDGRQGARPGNPTQTARYVQVGDNETLTREGDNGE